MYRTVILTVSDRCFAGERSDESGLLIEVSLPHDSYMITGRKIVPDDLEVIKGALLQLVNKGDVDLILTTGGTGFSPHDVTPEATAMVIQKPTPGIDFALYEYGLKKTPHAMLSRAKSGIRHKTLIINLPGSPKAVTEYVDFLLPVLPHALDLIRDEADENGHEFQVE